jgi:polyisoprenoid-binding protein YceI
MDEIMYGKLRAGSFNRITYTLTSLEFKEQQGDSNMPAFYEAVGRLGIAGVTNTITMPVSITPNSDGNIQFAGSTQVKMSDFKISPPSPSLGGVSIKTGDEVRLNFVWSLKRVRTVAAVK